MKSFLAALAVATAVASPADALTVIASGAYDSGASVFQTGSVALGPGRYRFVLAFTAAPLFQDSEVSKDTTTNFFCVDPDIQPGEFACGGDNVPTLTPFDQQTPLRYVADVTVAPLVSVPFPSDPIVRYEQFDTCCGYEVEFEAVDAGRWTLSYGAVPEPATWALMLLGFGAVGAAMRGRARRVLA